MPFRLFISSALAACALALTADQTTEDLNQLTTSFSNLKAPAQGITLANSAAYTGDFKTTFDGLNSLVTTTSKYCSDQANGDNTPFSAAEEDTVATAFLAWSQTQQDLLAILVDMSAEVSTAYIGPMNTLLESLENVDDSFALGIIDQTNSRTADFKASNVALDNSLMDAEDAYAPVPPTK